MTSPDVPVLAVYGTLAPGESNAEVLTDLDGRWEPATVRGHRFTTRWRTYTGFPGFVADPTGPEVAIQLFHSAALSDHWDRLDQFEGPGYRRSPVAATTADGTTVEAQIYEVRLVMDNTLALYGALRPGGADHHAISHLLPGGGRGTASDRAGYWFDAAVRGFQYTLNWGPAEGLDGISLDGDGHLVPVSVLVSAELDERWPKLDRTMGDGFDRHPTPLLSADGSVTLGTTSIYEARPDS